MRPQLDAPGEAARGLRLALVLVLLPATASLGQSAPHSPVEHASKHRPLSEILAANLPAWTAGTGVVERRTLQALASDPRIRGDDAAALATLLHHFHKAPFHSMPTAELEADGRDRLDHSYRGYATKLDKLHRTLFAEGRPTFARMQQGPAGDCYLFSGAGWWAYYRPERIVEMIRPTADGRYFVRFPDGESAVVDPPTDTELAYNESGSTATDGIWMAVLEKAVGTIAARHSEKARAIPDATLRVNLGGSAKVDVHRWTGRPVETFHLHDRAGHAKVREALVRMEHRRLMAQAVVPRTDPPGPIPGNHVYAILGFDPTTNVLTVWNPWGDNFTPKGPPGLQHGWPRKHGVFQIPLADFVRVFSTLDVERG